MNIEFIEEFRTFLESLSYSFSHNNNIFNIKNVKILCVPLFSQHNSDADIIIHEDIWHTKKEIVKSRIKSKLGLCTTIYGRNTILKAISNPELEDFLLKNHLNVPIKAKYKYGLFYKNELVCVAAYSPKKKYYRENGISISCELIRFCSKTNVNIVGGLSKLNTFFINEQKPDDIVTYIDKEWSLGFGFKKIGFRLLEETPPNIFYVNPKNYTRVYNEKEGYLKVENKGNLKLILNLK